MALNPIKQSGSGIIFLNIVGGELRQRVKEGTEGSEKRVTKDGKEVWELRHGSVSARIKSVEVYKNEVLKQKELVIMFEDIGDIYKVSLPMRSDYAQNFLDKLPNLPTSTIFFKPYCFEDKEKKDKEGNPKVLKGITLKIDGDKGDSIQRFFTKENPNGKPQWKEGMSERQLANWKLDVEEFYENTAKKYGERFAISSASAEPLKMETLKDDDLPF